LRPGTEKDFVRLERIPTFDSDVTQVKLYQDEEGTYAIKEAEQNLSNWYLVFLTFNSKQKTLVKQKEIPIAEPSAFNDYNFFQIRQIYFYTGDQNELFWFDKN